MRTFTIVAATIALAALTAVPASAERNWGPLSQNGQCWNAQVGHGGPNAGTWGYWAACPQKASATIATTTHRRAARRHSASR
jgi:hypothetical protein